MLKSSAAQLWNVLSLELQASSCGDQQINAPKSATVANTDVPSSVRLLVQQNDVLVYKLLQIYKNKYAKLDSIAREHAAARAALDITIDEQLKTIDKMELQIHTITSANAASEQRHVVEVS